MRALPALLPCLAAALQAPLRSRRLSTSLNILSPEAMVSLQKATNKAEFEDTVAKYAKQKRLSTRDAELEYARYLPVHNQLRGAPSTPAQVSPRPGQVRPRRRRELERRRGTATAATGKYPAGGLRPAAVAALAGVHRRRPNRRDGEAHLRLRALEHDQGLRDHRVPLRLRGHVGPRSTVVSSSTRLLRLGFDRVVSIRI